MINDLDFAEAVFRCEITGLFCHDGDCSDCQVAAYFCSWDDKQVGKIYDDIQRG